MLILVFCAYFIFIKAFSIYKIVNILLSLDIVILFLYLQFIGDLKRFPTFMLGLLKDLIYQHDVFCIYTIQYIALYYILMLVKSMLRDRIPFLIKLFIFSGVSSFAIVICIAIMLRYSLYIPVILCLKQWMSSVCWYVIGFNCFASGLSYYLKSDEYIYERRSKKS